MPSDLSLAFKMTHGVNTCKCRGRCNSRTYSNACLILEKYRSWGAGLKMKIRQQEGLKFEHKSETVAGSHTSSNSGNLGGGHKMSTNRRGQAGRRWRGNNYTKYDI